MQEVNGSPGPCWVAIVRDVLRRDIPQVSEATHELMQAIEVLAVHEEAQIQRGPRHPRTPRAKPPDRRVASPEPVKAGQERLQNLLEVHTRILPSAGGRCNVGTATPVDLVRTDPAGPTARNVVAVPNYSTRRKVMGISTRKATGVFQRLAGLKTQVRTASTAARSSTS